MNRTLVTYFSATGITKKIAERLAGLIGADIHEIIPAESYSQADLNWHDPQSRSSLETADEQARPAISGDIKDISAYDTIYIGFPIWWYREPRIIDTFLEAHDFTHKTIIPFVTSGASPIGQTVTYMQRFVPQAVVKAGKRFTADVTDEELKNWAHNV